jgi:dienelactone hydrolase
MKTRSSCFGRGLRVVAILLGIAILLLYLGLPAAMGVAAVIPARQPAGPPPQGYQQVTLTTQDGVDLQAWYRQPENGAAIILLHGAGGSRSSVRRYADMLARHGYGVLAVDLRGHGDSQGNTNRLGWQGTPDVGAAVAFLQAQPDVEAIGGLGLSMGGEVLLGAASEFPAIQAIAADGATRRSTDDLLALESERQLVRNFTARVMYATVDLLSDSQPPRPLLDSMVEARDTAFLLIAGGEKSLETAFNQLFAENLGERATLWVAPGAGHTQALALYPEEYERRVLAFFDTALRRPPE